MVHAPIWEDKETAFLADRLLRRFAHARVKAGPDGSMGAAWRTWWRKNCDSFSVKEAALQFLGSLKQERESLEGEEAFEAATVRGTLGDLNIHREEYEAAVSDYEAAARLNPSLQADHWVDLARLKAALGDESFAQAINHYSDGQEKSNNGDYESSQQAYRLAIDAAPDFPWGYNNMAWQMATCSDSA